MAMNVDAGLDRLRTAARVTALARRAAEAGNKNAVCDARVGALLAGSAVTGARYNVAINVKGLADRTPGASLLTAVGDLESTAGREAQPPAGR